MLRICPLSAILWMTVSSEGFRLTMECVGMTCASACVRGWWSIAVKVMWERLGASCKAMYKFGNLFWLHLSERKSDT